MNPYKHSEISVKKHGGRIEDYYEIHSFLDSTKEICSDNRHRILHNHWAIRRIIIPIFGSTIINSEGRKINTKDICEFDHILPDYRNKFIPTLNDFVEAISLPQSTISTFEEIVNHFSNNNLTTDLILSPLYVTGHLKSLIITCNSWFVCQILPLLGIQNFAYHQKLLSPSEIFKNMRFEVWMQNGAQYPPSQKMLNAQIIS